MVYTRTREVVPTSTGLPARQPAVNYGATANPMWDLGGNIETRTIKTCATSQCRKQFRIEPLQVMIDPEQGLVVGEEREKKKAIHRIDTVTGGPPSRRLPPLQLLHDAFT